jgi:hypothetical protein
MRQLREYEMQLDECHRYAALAWQDQQQYQLNIFGMLHSRWEQWAPHVTPVPIAPWLQVLWDRQEQHAQRGATWSHDDAGREPEREPPLGSSA